MQLQLDANKVYAIALQGGGAKGAYEVGVWRALEEAGIRYNAVAGTSVGALNGAMMAMRAQKKAEEFWRSMRFSMVMDVDDAFMAKVMEKDWSDLDIRKFAAWAAGIVKDGGFDVAPLQKLLREAIDEAAVRSSDVDFYLVTVSVSDRKVLNIRAKDLPEGQLYDMLLASAYLPAFKSQKLGGKRYADGGFDDAIPYDVLLDHGYRDLILVRLPGSIGRVKKVRIPQDAGITEIVPTRDLGTVLNFSSEQSNFDMELGYYDAQRVLYGLAGSWYYLERTWTEAEAYALLMRIVQRYDAAQKQTHSLYEIHHRILPALANEVGADGDYYAILIAYLECMAKYLKLPEFRIMTDAALYAEICASQTVISDPAAPDCLRYMPLKLRREDACQ